MDELIFFGILFLTCVLLLLWRGFAARKRSRSLIERQIKEEYGQPPQNNEARKKAAVTGSYLEYKPKRFCLDDITWNDLAMDRVFERLNYTRCSAGSEQLYFMLRCPLSDKRELEERNALIELFSGQESLREALSLQLFSIGFTGKYSLFTYMDYLDGLKDRSNLKHILSVLFYLPAAALLFFQPGPGVAVLFLVLAWNIMSYFKEKGEVNPYLVSFAYILRMLEGGERIVSQLSKPGEKGGLREPAAGFQALENLRETLQSDLQGLSGFRKFSGIAMSMQNPTGSSNPLDLLLDYLKMALHLDLMKFNQMLSVVKKHRRIITEMVSVIGTLDAVISIAYYRASLKGYCVPKQRPGEEKGGGLRLKGEGLYHPLLTEPVKNSIEAERGVLVTGSNASGKSTFLKTVAINAIFAQTICTCLGESWEAPCFRVMTSMSLQDNLSGGESYFMVEIKALKRILDRSEGRKQTEEGSMEDASRTGNAPVLCFVDEVLRGTNTVERIAASSQILKSLTGKRVLCFAATHDIELTQILEEDYDNYHFEEHIENGDISFDYLLRPGRAKSRNAIRLLEVMGYEAQVIEAAEELAEHFLNTGEWTT